MQTMTAGVYLHDGFVFEPQAQCPFYWTLDQWKRYVDYLVFCGIRRMEFCTQAAFLRIPSTDFERARIEKMQAVIEYAHTKGLACWLVVSSNVLSGVPDGVVPVGQQTEGAFVEPCPRDPAVRKQLLEVITYFVSQYRALDGYELFAGDWGGCCCGTCDIHTFFSLATDYYRIIRRHNPAAKVYLNTWCINYWRKLENKFDHWEEKFDMEAIMANQVVETIHELPGDIGITLPFHHLYRPLAIQNRHSDDCPRWPDRAQIEQLERSGHPVMAWPHFLMENDPYHQGRWGLFCARVGYLKKLLQQLEARGVSQVMGNLYHPYYQPLSGFAFGMLSRDVSCSVEEILRAFAALVVIPADVPRFLEILYCLERCDPWETDLPASHRIVHHASSLDCRAALALIPQLTLSPEPTPFLSTNEQILRYISHTLQVLERGAVQHALS